MLVLHKKDGFSYIMISLLGVHPCLNQQLKEYNSLRVRRFVLLEIFLPVQLKRHRAEKLPVCNTLQMNQSNNYWPNKQTVSLVRTGTKAEMTQW